MSSVFCRSETIYARVTLACPDDAVTTAAAATIATAAARLKWGIDRFSFSKLRSCPFVQMVVSIYCEPVLSYLSFPSS